ncbi:MAG: HAMP domain-containing sensor histidine kinase [Acetobacteraceae bacterium]
MGVLLAGGFTDRRRDMVDGGSANADPAIDTPSTRPVALAAGHLDLEVELHAVVRAHDAQAIGRHVRLETAVLPGLTVRTDAATLRQIVSALLANAIGHSAGGRVLLGAGRHGGRVRISVLDDGAPVERTEQEAHLRDAERLVALQGGTLEITVRPGAGTIVAVRLPEPAPNATPARVAQPSAQVVPSAPAEPPAARNTAAIRVE